MKKIIIILLSVLFASCVTVSKENLKLNGSYIDESFTHKITVKKSTPLAEFGINQEEWETLFSNSLLYKAHGEGNAFMALDDVKQYTCEAIKLTTRRQRMNYAALIEPTANSKTGISGFTTFQNNIATSHYSQTNKYSFDSYVIMFENEDLLPLLRETFGRIQVLKTR